VNFSKNLKNILIRKIEISDLSGEEEYREIRDLSFKETEAAVCVYSIINRNSFDTMEEKINQLFETSGNKNLPIILIANKIDLEDQRVVSKEEGQKLAEKFG
jgi:GTPase KRas